MAGKRNIYEYLLKTLVVSVMLVSSDATTVETHSLGDVQDQRAAPLLATARANPVSVYDAFAELNEESASKIAETYNPTNPAGDKGTVVLVAHLADKLRVMAGHPQNGTAMIVPALRSKADTAAHRDIGHVSDEAPGKVGLLYLTAGGTLNVGSETIDAAPGRLVTFSGGTMLHSFSHTTSNYRYAAGPFNLGGGGRRFEATGSGGGGLSPPPSMPPSEPADLPEEPSDGSDSVSNSE